MKIYTLTSHVADQLGALEAASLTRRRRLKPLLWLLVVLTVGALLWFGLRGQLQLAVLFGGAGVIALVVLGVIAIAGPNERDVAIKRSGAAGEAVLPQLLRSLPDSYTLLNGVPVPGWRADIDHVLVGPSGIWAIEAKHHVGMVQCVGDAWGYTRLGPGGVPREGHIGSPSQQVRRAAESLERYLRQHGGSRNIAGLDVQPLVVFTHPQVELDLEAPTLPIFKAAAVEAFIISQSVKLKPVASERIVGWLRELRPAQR
ncbi:MAG: NERD domain-containing protein [Chloroflexi bacterium]|nr:NERD domain-containing protein [Chloroflexota bacterium]